MSSSQNQGNSLSSFADSPMKRKRRRPCKGVSVGGENMKSNKQSVWISDHASADMLGQMVSGVIEGSFDAGYLVNVKVGETNSRLRGAVFQPGLFAPVTGANDVAPHAKMHERKDIPMPFVNLQVHPHVVSPSGKSEKPVERKNEASNLHDQGPHTGLKPGALVASDLPLNESGLPPGQKAMQEQSLDSGLHNDKAVEQHQSLQGFEEFVPMKAPREAAEFAATLPPTETINRKPRVEHQVLSYDLIPQELIHDDAMSLDVGNRKTLEISEPQSMACDTRSNMFNKQALSRQDTQLELARKIMNGGANTSHMDGLSASDDVNSSLKTATTYSIESDAKDVFRTPRF